MFPFSLPTYLRVFGLAFRDCRTPRRFLALCGLGVALPALALAAGLGLALDRRVFPGLAGTRVREPVFITGHARSGTTFLHRLLAMDTEHTAYFVTWEMLLPSALQRRLVAALGSLDTRLLGGAVKGWIDAWQERTFARARSSHPWDLWGAEEDGFLFIPTFLHAQIGVLFPYQQEMNRLWAVDRRPERDRRRIARFYAACLRGKLYTDGAERHYVSKTPAFVGMLGLLRETFPDARFIIPVRDPLETIPSLLALMVRTWRASGYSREEVQKQLGLLARQSFEFYRYPLEVLADLAEDRVAFVRYDELVERPADVARGIYERFGWEITPEATQAWADQQAQARTYTSEHRYSLDEYGLTAETIRAELPEVFRRFGFDSKENTA